MRTRPYKDVTRAKCERCRERHRHNGARQTETKEEATFAMSKEALAAMVRAEAAPAS